MMRALHMIVTVVYYKCLREVVYGIPMTAFDTYFNDFKTKHRYQNDAEIPAEGLQTM